MLGKTQWRGYLKVSNESTVTSVLIIMAVTCRKEKLFKCNQPKAGALITAQPNGRARSTLNKSF